VPAHAVTALLHRLLGDGDSVWSALAAYADAPTAALAPSPPLDAALHALVAVLQGASAPPPVLAAAAAALARRHGGATLAARAAAVRNVAQRAEGELERDAAGTIIARLAAARGGPPPAAAVDAGEVPGDGWEGGVAPVAVAALAAAARPFPYVDHYVRLVAAEAAALSAVVRAGRGDGGGGGGGGGIRLAFCGSGPLPLTGCLLAAAGCAAQVTLIDIDAAAVAASKRVLAAWVDVGALAPGIVSVVHADATAVDFTAAADGAAAINAVGAPTGDTAAAAATRAPIAADVVFVAALLPPAAKMAVAERLSRRYAGAGAGAGADAGVGVDTAPLPIVAVRTAHGLTAELTYEASGRAELSRLLPFIGVVVPRTHAVAPTAGGGGGGPGGGPGGGGGLGPRRGCAACSRQRCSPRWSGGGGVGAWPAAVRPRGRRSRRSRFEGPSGVAAEMR